jgi:hypothetical protein
VVYSVPVSFQGKENPIKIWFGSTSQVDFDVIGSGKEDAGFSLGMFSRLKWLISRRFRFYYRNSAQIHLNSFTEIHRVFAASHLQKTHLFTIPTF